MPTFSLDLAKLSEHQLSNLTIQWLTMVAVPLGHLAFMPSMLGGNQTVFEFAGISRMDTPVWTVRKLDVLSSGHLRVTDQIYNCYTLQQLTLKFQLDEHGQLTALTELSGQSTTILKNVMVLINQFAKKNGFSLFKDGEPMLRSYEGEWLGINDYRRVLVSLS